MSILIKGMEMPKTEEESKLLILTPDGVTWLTQLGLGNQKFDTIEVPPHGRLIDADALLADVRAHSESYFADDFAHEWVDVAPTIIPADKDGET